MISLCRYKLLCENEQKKEIKAFNAFKLFKNSSKWLKIMRTIFNAPEKAKQIANFAIRMWQIYISFTTISKHTNIYPTLVTDDKVIMFVRTCLHNIKPQQIK